MTDGVTDVGHVGLVEKRLTETNKNIFVQESILFNENHREEEKTNKPILKIFYLQ